MSRIMQALIVFSKVLYHLHPPAALWIWLRWFSTPNRIPRPPFENELIKTGRRVMFRTGLVAYHFGEGPPVLLVHGWEGRGTQLGAVVGPLVQRGFSVYALDNVAHGESPGASTSPTHTATFIKSTANEIGPLKAIIAHSFGAGSSVLAAHDGTRVEKLVLVAGPDRYDRVVEHFCRRLGLSESATADFIAAVAIRSGIHPVDLQISRFASSIRQKVLLVHDEDDKSVPVTTSKHIHESLPGSEILLTKGLGHRRILKDPAVVEKIVSFIT